MVASLSCGPLIGPALDVGSLSRLLTKQQASVDAQRVESATACSVLAIVNFSLRDGIDTVAICSQLSKLVESYTVLACKGLASECQILQTTTCTRGSTLMQIQMFVRRMSQAGDSLSEMNAPVVQQNFLTLLSIVCSSMLSDCKLTHQALLQHLPHDREAAVEMLR